MIIIAVYLLLFGPWRYREDGHLRIIELLSVLLNAELVSSDCRSFIQEAGLVDQGAGETEQKLRPPVETRGIHPRADGRPPSRICSLGQSRREKGLSCLFSPLVSNRHYVFLPRLWLFCSCSPAVLPTAALHV